MWVAYPRESQEMMFDAHARAFTFFGGVPTPINEGLVRSLHTGAFLVGRRNIALVGGTGTGKTHLAIAITANVVRAGVRGRFFNTVDLVNRLEEESRLGNASASFHNVYQRLNCCASERRRSYSLQVRTWSTRIHKFERRRILTDQIDESGTTSNAGPVRRTVRARNDTFRRHLNHWLDGPPVDCPGRSGCAGVLDPSGVSAVGDCSEAELPPGGKLTSKKWT